MTRPEDAAALAELERQAGQNIVQESIMHPGRYNIHGIFDLRALVDAVLAAHREEQQRYVADLIHREIKAVVSKPHVP